MVLLHESFNKSLLIKSLYNDAARLLNSKNGNAASIYVLPTVGSDPAFGKSARGVAKAAACRQVVTSPLHLRLDPAGRGRLNCRHHKEAAKDVSLGWGKIHEKTYENGLRKQQKPVNACRRGCRLRTTSRLQW